MSTATATPQPPARSSKIPIRLSQAIFAPQDFEPKAVDGLSQDHMTGVSHPRPILNNYKLKSPFARPNRYRCASRSIERSLGQQWSLKPDYQAYSMNHENEREECDELEVEDTAEKVDDEMCLPVSAVAVAQYEEEDSDTDANASIHGVDFEWDLPVNPGQFTRPRVYAAIANALETLDDRLEQWRNLGLQGWSEEPCVAPGQGRLLDISGLSQKILADCSLPISRETDLEHLKQMSSATGLNLSPHMLGVRPDFQQEALVRLLGMLQHILVITEPKRGIFHDPCLRWNLVVKGTLDLSLDLQALGSTLRLVLCVSQTQREEILAFFGHPFT